VNAQTLRRLKLEQIKATKIFRDTNRNCTFTA